MPQSEDCNCGAIERSLGSLAAGDAIFRFIAPTRDRIVFQTEKVGELIVTRDGDLLSLDFPAYPPVPCPQPQGLAAALGHTPAAMLAARYYLAVYEDANAIAVLRPDLAAVAPLDRPALIVTAPGESGTDFVSRVFAPAVGIDEDPATGAAHCTLTPYWAARLAKDRLLARQLSRRGGSPCCMLRGDRVSIAGRAVL